MIPRNTSRTNQISDLIQRELSWILQRYIADPRLKGLTITHVQISKDLNYADVKITQLNPIDIANLLQLLKKAASKLRYHLAQQLNLRVTPRLRFQYDTFMNESTKLHAKIDQIIQKDKAFYENSDANERYE